MRSTSDYLSKITPYHRKKPKFAQTVAISVAPLADLQSLFFGMPAVFDIDLAVGAQLDADGEWVGRSRNIPIPLPSLWFSLDDPIRGVDQGFWWQPYASGISITALGDDEYRRLLYAKRAANAWDGTAGTLQAIYTDFIPGPNSLVFVECRDDLTMNVCVSQQQPSIVDAYILYEDLIPARPAGIKTTYLFPSVNNTSLFGLDVDNAYIGGLDHASWGIEAPVLANLV